VNRGRRVARVQAQAKLNLFLRVGPRENDGYHQLLTLFHRIDLADDLMIRVGGGGAERSLSCSGPALPAEGLGPPDANLAMRAATLYAHECGWPDGFSIELVKRIPVGGGLGGGSADAGAVLRAFDALSPRPMGDGLRELGAQLGADVPFLASDRVAAFAIGRGDELMSPQLTEPTLSSRPVLLLLPAFGVTTAEAYRWLDESNRPLASDGRSLGRVRWSWSAVEQLACDLAGGNDFEAVVEQRHPVLRACRERLRAAGARIARLSGSGSTVFGVFHSPVASIDGLPNQVAQLATRTSTRVVQVEAQE